MPLRPRSLLPPHAQPVVSANWPRSSPAVDPALKKANIISSRITRAKVIASGEIGTAVIVRGVGVTKGARAAIEAAGGKIEE